MGSKEQAKVSAGRHKEKRNCNYLGQIFKTRKNQRVSSFLEKYVHNEDFILVCQI